VLLFLLLLKQIERFISAEKMSPLWVTVGLLFIIFFDSGLITCRGGLDIYYHGYFRGEKDPWADVQMYAREHSPKDALFIVPPYINDFGLYSERATLGDWAEGANILYMDNVFAKEWLARMNALGWKDLWGAQKGYNRLSTEEVLKAAQKYGASHIVTEKPKHFELKALYENEQFVLYKIPEIR
jgi:hypothetical protein